MRKALYQYLTNNCVSITRWLQPYQAVADTPKPYGVILVSDDSASLNNSRGYFQEIEIWPYLKPGSFLALDEAVRELYGLLAGQYITTESGARVLLEWVGKGRDYYDPDLKAITRRMFLRMPHVRKS